MEGKILYATNLSKPTFKVMEGLSGISEIGLKELVLLYAMKKGGRREGDKSKGVPLDLFKQWEKRLNDYGMKANIRIESGRLASSVLNAMQGNGISLVILHLNKKKDRMLFGSSTVRNIIKATEVPVLVVDEDEKGLKFASKGIFERVLWATDWSPSSEKALQYILGFKALISELDIVNVIYEKLTVRALRQLKARLIQTRKRCLDQGIEAEYHLYAGETADEIVLAAREYDSTSIILGTTRSQKLKDIFLGKPSLRVAEKAPIPTLIVP